MSNVAQSPACHIAKTKKTRRTILILSAVAVCSLATVGYCQGLAGLENLLLFHPSGKLGRTPAAIGLKFDEVTLQTADQVKIHAWWIPCKRARAALILSHGNGGNISYRLEKLRIFHSLNLDVLMYDYRGYGKSEGKPSEAGVYSDVQAAYDFLVQQKEVPPGRIIAYGESLGGPVAAHLASKNEVGALILDSTFTSLKDIAEVHLPLLAGLVQSQYDTLADAATLKQPVLVLHSPDDEIIPCAQGKRLFEVVTAPKQFVELRGDHNSGFLKSKKSYVTGLDGFLDAHFPASKH
jgi:uncharacterized protein